jgi:DNA (cytosine-5)-methyltransferase 1
MNLKFNEKIYAVDLFCGAGGLTLGLKNAGIDVKCGVDLDPACEYPYTANNDVHFLKKSVEKISCDDLIEYYPSDGYRLLAGCAPCQTFSTYNQKANTEDKRWWLLDQFSRLVQETNPDFVTMENVPGLLKHKVFYNFKATLEEQGYYVSEKVVSCSEYGIPQKRRRLVLLASKHGPIKLLSPDELRIKKKNVRDVIEGLPLIEDGEICKSDPLHQSSKLSSLNMKRMKASRPGGTWREWSEKLIVNCHKKNTGKHYGSVYGRMEWDAPSPTITTQFFGFGNGRFGHPMQDRALSLREGALIQGFPRKYKFVEEGKQISKKNVGKLIGNAVPVKLGEIIGLSIRKHLTNLIPKRHGEKK